MLSVRTRTNKADDDSDAEWITAANSKGKCETSSGEDTNATTITTDCTLSPPQSQIFNHEDILAASLVSHEEEPHFKALLVEKREEVFLADGSPDRFLDNKQATGSRRTSWRTRFQKILYRRTHEEALLHQAFDACRVSGNELILISGQSGTGKTRLGKTLKSRVQEGYFILGKFDQLQRAAPYTAFVNAFTDWTYQVQSRGPEEVEKIQKAIQGAIGTDTSVLIGMIPALETVLGSPEADPGKAQTNTGGSVLRFVFVFRLFLRSICSPDKPLVLFLDNLQFADMCSLDLFSSIASDKENHGFIILGTCDDSVKPKSYLAAKLRELENQSKTKITNISLSNLSHQDISRFLNDTLRLDPEHNDALTNLLFVQTKGNILYIIEFLGWLQESGNLVLDTDTGQWSVDTKEVQIKTGTCSMRCTSGDFLMNIMKSLSTRHQDVLRVAACLGSTLNETLISYVVEFEVKDVLEDLRWRGLLRNNNSSACYEFDHDGVQNAAYQLTPESERELFHLEIGRRTWRKLSSEQLDKYIFVILAQMNIGRNLIRRDQERTAVATLCLHAGKKAARASTFRTAAVYLDLGLSLLDEKQWRTNYDLMLALHNASAEMEMCRANFDRMNQILGVTIKHGRLLQDVVQAYMTKIIAFSTQDKPTEAVELGLMVLDQLGEGIPLKPSRFKLIAEYRSIKKLLKGKSDEQLLRIETMTDESKLRTLLILYSMLLPALLKRPDLAPFLILKAMKITLKYGLSVLASTAFSTFGMFCIMAGGNTNEADRFARLSLVLLERFKAKEYLAGVYVAVFGCVNVWSRSVHDSLEPLLEGNRVGAQTGNYEYAGLCANQYCFNAIDSGLPLDQICNQWQGFHETLSTNRQESLLRMAMPSVQAVHIYMGVKDDTLSPQEEVLDYDLALQQAEKDGALNVIAGIKFCRMTMCYVFGDYDGAFRHRLTLKEIMEMPPTLERSSSVFYLGMTSIEMARQKIDVRRNVQLFKKTLGYLRGWNRSCPQNFVDKVFLMEAEFASFQGRNGVAFEKFVCAVGMAKANGFVHIAGIANERLARHFERIGETTNVRQYWEEAREMFQKWKAHALVRRVSRILEEFPK